MEEQASIHQEKNMLESMLKLNAASDQQDLFSEAHRLAAPLQSQGIATVTLEEYADQEMTSAIEREAPQGPRRYDQLLEYGNEDDEGLAEIATYKDRAWDDWKDANKKMWPSRQFERITWC
ncbi:hypothetical protein CCR75_009557 [Bremia lactucae]|uniref:Uncharacterized protein n=1 Tax=Bremia lactucae TaxID=4779 RepID=A0A976IF38_BRELC|nr:hypothetical protein CCR75_009557 [Bremia lactucae]